MSKSRRIYKLPVNTIHEGESNSLLKNKDIFPDESIDFIITSPPYADKRKKVFGGVHPDDYVDWFLPISEQLLRVLKINGSFILNIKEHARNGERDTYVIELILDLKHQGWFWVEEYCWYKKNSYPGKWPNRFRDSWERCLHFTRSKQFKMYQNAVKVPIGNWADKRFKSMSEKDFKRNISNTNSNLGRNVSNWLNKKKVFPHNVIVFEEEHYVSNVFESATVCNNRNHSAAYPLELPTWFLKLFSRKGDVVLDPFIGSGTTAYVAMAMERKYIGIEQNHDYIELANKQIHALINGKENNQLRFSI